MESKKEEKEEKHDTKLKILAAGDIHGDIGLAEKLAEKAKKENVDLVVLCGDLTMGERSTENIIGPFKKRHEKVLLIPGNHETVATADFLAQLYGMKNIHGYSVKYKDVGIFGAGGANIGVFQIDEKEIYDLLKKGYDKNPFKELLKLWALGLYPIGVLKDRKFHIYYVPLKKEKSGRGRE